MERSLGHRAPLFWLLVPFVVGLVMGRSWDSAMPMGVAVPVAFSAGVLGVIGARREGLTGAILWAAGVWLSLVVAGIVWIKHAEALIPEWQHLPRREAVLTVRIDRTFPQLEGRDAVSGLGLVIAGEGTAAEIAGRKVYFSTVPAPDLQIRRGASVKMKGILESVPRPDSGAGFDEYLRNAGVGFRLSRGRMIEESEPPGHFHRTAGAVAQYMESALSVGLEDHAHLRGVYLAMLLGRKAELTPEQEEIFLKSGTLHLFAISGLHIGGMSIALLGALLLLRVPRRYAAVAGLLGLWIYVQATGAQPSSVRAWTMIAFVMLARELKWPGNAISAIVASALFVLMVDPFQVFGASFQMSYSVVASLLLLGVPLADRADGLFKPFSMLPPVTWRRWHRAFATSTRWLLKTGSICLAATLISMPMAVEVFGYFTPGAFFANLMVVPMAGLVVAAGFCAASTGMIGIPLLPTVFNHAAAVVITVMERILANVVRVPGVAHTAEFRADWMGPSIVAALLVILVAGYAGRWSGPVRFWMPLAFLAVAHAGAVRFTSG